MGGQFAKGAREAVCQSDGGSKDIRYTLPAVEQKRVRTRNQAVLRLVRSALGDALAAKAAGKRILDLGSGRGEFLQLLVEQGYFVIGLDVDDNCVRMGSRYTKCLKGDAREVDHIFDREYFDLVVSSHLLEHLENPKEVVEKIRKVAKRYILLVVPNLAQFITLEHRNPGLVRSGHLHGWDPSHFRTFLEVHCGLRILKWECDQVILPFRPVWERIRPLWPLFHWIETRFLPKIFPYISNSLIVLCEKQN